MCVWVCVYTFILLCPLPAWHHPVFTLSHMMVTHTLTLSVVQPQNVRVRERPLVHMKWSQRKPDFSFNFFVKILSPSQLFIPPPPPLPGRKKGWREWWCSSSSFISLSSRLPGDLATEWHHLFQHIPVSSNRPLPLLAPCTSWNH